MIRWAILFFALAGPALAQDVQLDWRVVTECYHASEPQDAVPACIGAATSRCIDETPQGYTTAGMTACAVAETAIWDEFLNTAYQDLRAQMREMDAMENTGEVSRADALRDAQRAWIAFRDAECDFNWAMFQEGTIRSNVYAACVQDLTAQRALELRHYQEQPG